MSIGISNGVLPGHHLSLEPRYPDRIRPERLRPSKVQPCADTPIAWRSEQDDCVSFLRMRPALGCSPPSGIHRWTLCAQAKSSSASRRAGARGGARAGRPRCVRIFTTAAPSRIAATSLRSPPQSGQCSRSTRNTRRKSFAQPIRALRRGGCMPGSGSAAVCGSTSRPTPPCRPSVPGSGSWATTRRPTEAEAPSHLHAGSLPGPGAHRIPVAPN